MFNYLLAAEDAESSTGLFGDNNWIMWIIIAVVLVLMVVMTVIPQRKRKKEQEQMMNNIQVGAKIMTIGRMVGRITQVNSDNTLIVNVGTEQNPTLIVIDRQAVGMVLEAVTIAPAPVVEEPAVEETVVDETIVEETVADEVFEQAPVEEVAVEQAPAEEEAPVEKKKSKKSNK